MHYTKGDGQTNPATFERKQWGVEKSTMQFVHYLEKSDSLMNIFRLYLKLQL
jgi:hypothetical protein